MNRRELLRQLAEQDADYVVDVLNITSADLLRKFPARVAAFLDNEADEQEEADGDDDSF